MNHLDPDWDLLSYPEVAEVMEQVVAKVAKQYPTTDQDDLAQELAIIVATRPAKVSSYLNVENWGGLHHCLWQDLVDSVRPQARRDARTISYEAAVEAVAA